MNIIKNEKLIRRNGKIGQWTSLGALAVLGIGMYISIKKPELFIWSLAALLAGFSMSQMGMYYGNRWGRSPRPDELLDSALKGLPGDFTIYHFATPASHVLLSPAGIWVLMPYHQRGRVVFEKNRWRVKGGGIMQGYMRVFGQEGLGRPEIEARNEVDALTKALAREMGESQLPPVQAALVFTADDVQVEAGESPLPAMPLKKLKDFMRQRAKARAVPALALSSLQTILGN
jgi:hypothetical protein